MARKRKPKKTSFCLQEALESKGLSKRRLASLTGIPYPMVIRLSKHEANPQWETIVKIAEAMGVDPGAFFWRTWVESPPP